jgi:lambda family phage minor tail protein L
VSLTNLIQAAKIHLYEIDLSALGVADKYRFHTENQVGTIIFDDRAFSELPIQVEGFEISGKGTLPTPTMTVSNIFGIFSDLLTEYDGLVGAKITRFITTPDHLNQVGDNYTINDPDEWYVTSYTDNAISVGLQLKSALDLQAVKLPNRKILRDICSWVYKSAECGYVGTLPACDKSLNDCYFHFPYPAPANFGGFPGIDLLQTEN